MKSWDFSYNVNCVQTENKSAPINIINISVYGFLIKSLCCTHYNNELSIFWTGDSRMLKLQVSFHPLVLLIVQHAKALTTVVVRM